MQCSRLRLQPAIGSARPYPGQLFRLINSISYNTVPGYFHLEWPKYL
jgi:hypothetical protein